MSIYKGLMNKCDLNYIKSVSQAQISTFFQKYRPQKNLKYFKKNISIDVVKPSKPPLQSITATILDLL
jgi:hypothetical protein